MKKRLSLILVGLLVVMTAFTGCDTLLGNDEDDDNGGATTPVQTVPEDVGDLKADDAQITALSAAEQEALTQMFVDAHQVFLDDGIALGAPAGDPADQVHWWDATFTQNLAEGDNELGDPWSMGLSAILAAKGPNAYKAYAITDEVLMAYGVGPAVTGAPLANQQYDVQSFENGYFTVGTAGSAATWNAQSETVAWSDTGSFTAKQQDQVLSQIKRGLHVARAAGYNVGSAANFSEWSFGAPALQVFNSNLTGGDAPAGATYSAWGLTGIVVGSLEADAGYVIANEIFFEWHRVGNGGGSPGAAITPPIFGGTLSWDATAGHAVITGGDVDYTATKDGVMQVFQGGVIEIDATNGDASTGALWKDNATLEADL